MRTVRHAEAVWSRKHRYDFWKIDRRPYGLVNTLEHRFATSAAFSTSGKVKSQYLNSMSLFLLWHFCELTNLFRTMIFCEIPEMYGPPPPPSPLYFATVIECVTRGDISHCKIFARKRENCFTTTASIDVTSIKHDYRTHLYVTHGRALLSSSFFFSLFFFLNKPT